MGWGIDALRRELDIMAEVIMGTVRGHGRRTAGGDATGVLNHLIDRAATISGERGIVAHGREPADGEDSRTPVDIAEIADIVPRRDGAPALKRRDRRGTADW